MAERSPGQWLEFLEAALSQRWARWIAFDAYYEGDHQLQFATAKFREAFGHLFATVADNWMQIVVDAPVERLQVQGFRFGEQQADDEAWEIWQANDLDTEADMVHTEAVKLGEAYWMVEPNGGDLPTVTCEHPSQVIVALAGADRRIREAGLKKWYDDGWAYANVYLPGAVHKYRSKERGGLILDSAGRVQWTRIDQLPNPLGEVPLVPIRNNPSMLGGGKSDLAGGVIHLQNAVNKLLSDMLIGSEYQAFPQRVLLGVEQPVDPSTGRPMRATELQQAVSRVWYVPNEAAKAHEFSAAELSNYTEASQHLVRHLTAQTKTPPHYILGEIVNASGDALKAAETGLVSKTRRKTRPFGGAHEEALRLCFRAIDANDPRAGATDAETIWADIESRSQTELADSLVKLAAIGVPEEVLWEKYGFSPQEIDRMKQLKEEEALAAEVTAALAQPTPEEAVVASVAEQPAPDGNVPA